MDVEPVPRSAPRALAPLGWLKDTNHHEGVIALVRRARRVLPGDPEFGDPLSVDGDGGPRAAAR
ncbi:guanylate cyclase, partial [Mycolicibacterium phlei DSM 43071]